MEIKCLCAECDNYQDGNCAYDEVRIIKGSCEGYVQKEMNEVE